MTYDAGRHALADQETLVSGIRQPTGTLLAANALVASFLGSVTIRAQGLKALSWIALVALVLGLCRPLEASVRKRKALGKLLKPMSDGHLAVVRFRGRPPRDAACSHFGSHPRLFAPVPSRHGQQETVSVQSVAQLSSGSGSPRACAVSRSTR